MSLKQMHLLENLFKLSIL